MFEENKLSREDQAKVDEYLQTGFNGIERRPFRPLRLLGVIWIIVAGSRLYKLVHW
jgi:hypothetical protein